MVGWVLFNFRKPAEKSFINIIYWVNTEETWLVPCKGMGVCVGGGGKGGMVTQIL